MTRRVLYCENCICSRFLFSKLPASESEYSKVLVYWEVSWMLLRPGRGIIETNVSLGHGCCCWWRWKLYWIIEETKCRFFIHCWGFWWWDIIQIPDNLDPTPNNSQQSQYEYSLEMYITGTINYSLFSCPSPHAEQKAELLGINDECWVGRVPCVAAAVWIGWAPGCSSGSHGRKISKWGWSGY